MCHFVLLLSENETWFPFKGSLCGRRKTTNVKNEMRTEAGEIWEKGRTLRGGTLSCGYFNNGISTFCCEFVKAPVSPLGIVDQIERMTNLSLCPIGQSTHTQALGRKVQNTHKVDTRCVIYSPPAFRITTQPCDIDFVNLRWASLAAAKWIKTGVWFLCEGCDVELYHTFTADIIFYHGRTSSDADSSSLSWGSQAVKHLI